MKVGRARDVCAVAHALSWYSSLVYSSFASQRLYVGKLLESTAFKYRLSLYYLEKMSTCTEKFICKKLVPCGFFCWANQTIVSVLFSPSPRLEIAADGNVTL